MTLKENIEQLSRRKFISGSASALALAPMAPLALGHLDVPASMAAAQARKIITRKLGKTGIEVPIVSMGVMNADNPAVVKESYEIGVRFFDTAAGYQMGRNEEMVGKVIKELGARKKVYIQTKIHKPRLDSADAVAKQMLSDFDKCLQRLQMDYVDILLVHGPSVAEMNEPGVKQAMAEVKKLKKAHHIGVSTHMDHANVILDAAKGGFYEAVTVAYNFTQAQDTALLDAIKKAHAAGVGIIAMKTQASGRRGPNAPEGPAVNQTAALKWVLNHKEIATAIPGYTNFDHMKEDFSVAYGLDYTDVEKKFLSEKNLVASVQFCQQCSNCRETCPKGVDVPTLMRTHMYAAKYGNFVHARATLDGIAATASLRNCSDCSECEAKCAHHVGIAENIRDLKSMYL
ncbi:MAG: aldo/keto reductase [Acidobacteriota bacterium]|jgi:predicted aldo/keto reductase-like oxidoreductase|nr:aldo/keto reductase [Acidobacteriota bacterium]